MQTKITFERKVLKANLELLAMAQSSKAIIPIMNYMKFVIKSGNMFMISTSEDISIKKHIGQTEAADMSFIFDAKPIISILNKSSEVSVILNFHDKGLDVYEGLTGEYNFPILANPDEFPVFPKTDKDAVKFVVKGLELKKAIGTAIKYMGTNESIPFLNGLSIANKSGALEIVASSGHTLAIEPIGKDPGNFDGIILPRRLAGFIHKLIVDMPVTIQATAANTMFGISSDTVIHSKNMEGRIAGYMTVVPNKDTAIDTITIDRLKFMEVVDKLNSIGNILVFEIRNTIMTVTAENIETSRKAWNKLSVERIKNEDVKGSVNIDLLIDLLQSNDKEMISLELFPHTNGTIRAILDRNNHTHLLMCIVI